MGVFQTKKVLYGSASLIPMIAEQIKQEFESEGYEVQADSLLSGGSDVFITKGGIFKAALGMRTALKVSLVPQDNSILFNASVGVFGQQAIPTVISMLFFWPVLITQIWGLVQQAQLDDKALKIADQIVYSQKESIDISSMKYCTHCGSQVPESAVFCFQCDTRL